jgi:catechol 2,3-dioxygenase-like lactoylglutathione lyase family enzyme
MGWIGTRLAYGTRELSTTVAFYRDELGLTVTGQFVGHDGFDGVFLALPGGGGELELTHGGAAPVPGREEELLVLYADDLAALRSAFSGRAVPAGNPYWDRWGITVLDPDGRRVVLATRPSEGP